MRSVSLESLFESRFAIVPIASRYIKPSLTDYVQLALEKNVMRFVQAPELDLCTDPVEVSLLEIRSVTKLTGSYIIDLSTLKRLTVAWLLQDLGTWTPIRSCRLMRMLVPSTSSVSLSNIHDDLELMVRSTRAALLVC